MKVLHVLPLPVLLLLLVVLVLPAPTAAHKVAIIGAGIGGASTVHFLSDLATSSSPTEPLNVHVFDALARVGGRTKHFSVPSVTSNTQVFELGGSIFLDLNHYMMRFTQRTGLETVEPSSSDFALGLWHEDSRSFTFEHLFGEAAPSSSPAVTSSESTWVSMLRALPYSKSIDLVRMLWHFGPFTFAQLGSHISEALRRWNRLYDLQDERVAFDSVPDFLSELGLLNFTQQSMADLFPSDQPGLGSSALLRDLGFGVNKANYNQDLDKMSALVGLISLSPFASGAGVLTTRDGNAVVARRLLDMGGAKVHLNSRCSSVTRVTASNQYRLDCGGDELFDAVVVATPLEHAGLSFHSFDGGEPQIPKRTMRVTHSTFVHGVVNKAYFDRSPGDRLPGVILVANSTARPVFSAFSCWWLNPQTGEQVTKIFSREPITESELQKMFLPGFKVLEHERWHAYPTYNPPERFAPTRLFKGEPVFYLNSIETAVSALEVSSIWGRNTALLLAHHFGFGDVTLHGEPPRARAPPVDAKGEL